MCKACRTYFLCFHIIKKQKFSINTNSFKLNWLLNHIIENKLDHGDWQSKLLDAIYYDGQLQRGISAWGLQNMEIVLFEKDSNVKKDQREKAYCYPIADELAEMLLTPHIASLLSKLHSKIIWRIILEQQYDY